MPQPLFVCYFRRPDAVYASLFPYPDGTRGVAMHPSEGGTIGPSGGRIRRVMSTRRRSEMLRFGRRRIATADRRQWTDSVISLLVQRGPMPTVEVSEYVKSSLDEIYDREEHKSYDSVLRSLLGNYEQ